LNPHSQLVLPPKSYAVSPQRTGRSDGVSPASIRQPSYRGRKGIVSADGIELAPATKPQPDGTLITALARAHRWQRLLEAGCFGTLAEVADAERLSRFTAAASCISRSSIVERILDGRPTAGLAQFLKPFPAEWARQRMTSCVDAAARVSTASTSKILGEGVLLSLARRLSARYGREVKSDGASLPP
jgi:hypothetical protein